MVTVGVTHYGANACSMLARANRTKTGGEQINREALRNGKLQPYFDLAPACPRLISQQRTAMPCMLPWLGSRKHGTGHTTSIVLYGPMISGIL